MNKSFTIVEVLITVTILIVVMILVFSVYFTGQKFYSRGDSRAELLQNGRVVLERLTREIRQAREIVSELAEDKTGATSTIMFEDGHSTTSYQYIRYFKDSNFVQREVIGYYFSGDANQTLVAWDAVPPDGQTLEKKVLETVVVVGEYVQGLQIWNPRVVYITLTLQSRNENIELSTKIFARNL